jgi:hypothetical protein
MPQEKRPVALDDNLGRWWFRFRIAGHVSHVCCAEPPAIAESP